MKSSANSLQEYIAWADQEGNVPISIFVFLAYLARFKPFPTTNFKDRMN